MTQNRWVRTPPAQPAPPAAESPVLPSIEAVYLTDPAILASVLPPPLHPPDEPRVHVRITEIDLSFPGGYRWQERVAYFAVDARYDEQPVEYPLIIPIDMESAVAISRERHGEPKKLAQIDFRRDADHVEGRVTRDGVTFIEIVGDVAGPLPVPDPYPATQIWYKFLPAVNGRGFDAGPFLVRVDQVRSPETLQRIDGKLVLRDVSSAPVADLPLDEMVSLTFTTRRSTHHPTLVGLVDPDGFEPFAAARYDHY